MDGFDFDFDFEKRGLRSNNKVAAFFLNIGRMILFALFFLIMQLPLAILFPFFLAGKGVKKQLDKLGDDINTFAESAQKKDFFSRLGVWIYSIVLWPIVALVFALIYPFYWIRRQLSVVNEKIKERTKYNIENESY